LRELIQYQLLVLSERARSRRISKPHQVRKPDRAYADLISSLPFQLTAAQNRAIAEIVSDLIAPAPMRRLLQGDVGSGKTVVAALALTQVARSGLQAALMAPTEILARQHADTIETLLSRAGVTSALLTGSTSASERRDLLARLEAGELSVLVGTHALISADVHFQNLAFAVVDEQHRFGVGQRQELLAGGRDPDLLVMTATPIPRTLALTAYGDLDLSLIDQLPPGRRLARTALRGSADRPHVHRFLRDEVRNGNQAFIIYPIVEESERSDLKAATLAYQELSDEVFPDLQVGLVHGQMPRADQEKVMADFAAGQIGILVATTVVEVGLDIPGATAVVIEHAERFGLSQLHQLRGRVGRSDRKSYCVLMTDEPHDSPAFERLQAFVSCKDGFAISELDLSLRGPGDLLGRRQSGRPLFRVVDLAGDLNLILTARECATKLLDNQYRLEGPEKVRLNGFVSAHRDPGKPDGFS
jgi:ATP-dependent DNA helicase RecG